MNTPHKNPLGATFGFFGSSELSVYVLDALERAGFLPEIVVTTPDKPRGRNLVLSPTEVKTWAQARAIPVLTPPSLKDDAVIADLKLAPCDVYIVASYGKIIPESILYLPPRKTLNVHPSLLPKYRGPSPIQSMILADERHIGVSIMELDKEMDHGPIVASKEVLPAVWPMREIDLEKLLGEEGGALLASLLPDWIAGKLLPKEQDHKSATYTKKITKEEGLLDLTGDPHTNLLKIFAFQRFPKPYFFDEPVAKDGMRKRIIVTDASIEDGKLILKKVIPEGKREMPWSDYLKGKR